MSCPGSAAVPEPRPSEVRSSFLTGGFSGGYRPVAVDYLPPAILSATPPVFPAPAANDEAMVQVGLSLLVDSFGHVAKVTVTRSAGEPFDEAAKAAAGLFEFRPALRAGAPVRAKLPWTVTFRRTGRP